MDTAQEFADDVPDLGTCGRSEGAALTGAGTPTHPSAGDQPPHPSAGDQAPHASAGDQAPHPSAGDQPPHPSAGGQAPPHRCDLCGLALHGLAEFQSHLDGHSRRLDVSSDHSGSDTGAENREQDECRNVRRTYQDSKPSLDSSGQQRRSHASTVSDGVSASRVTDESGDEEDGAPGSGPHRCKKCGNCYKYARGLKTHLATHSDKASHKCSLCERAYKRRDVLLRHIREVHFGDVKPKTKDLKLRHVCDLCGKGFAAPIALKRHIKCHMGEKPFRCGECFKTFALKGDLTKHYMTHTQERPHKCELCDMQFARRTTLQKHMRIHTGEKPYTCETCGQGFSRQDVLSTHQRRHTGEQPYKCGICGAGFTHKPPLVAHLKKNGKCAGSNRQGDC